MKNSKKSDKLGDECLKWLDDHCIDYTNMKERVLGLVRAAAKEAYESKDISKVATAAWLIEKTGVSWETIRRKLRELVNDGLVKSTRSHKAHRWLPTSLED